MWALTYKEAHIIAKFSNFDPTMEVLTQHDQLDNNKTLGEMNINKMVSVVQQFGLLIAGIELLHDNIQWKQISNLLIFPIFLAVKKFLHLFWEMYG